MHAETRQPIRRAHAHRAQLRTGKGAGIAVRKSDTELRDKLSAAIQAIRASGTYKQIAARYFDFDIYGK